LSVVVEVDDVEVADILRQSRMVDLDDPRRIPAPGPAAIAKVLGDIRELIVQGGFVHTPKKDDCRFCDYTAVCGEDVHTQAKAKLQDSRLTAYGRLAAHV
jgi:hypothetical protein